MMMKKVVCKAYTKRPLDYKTQINAHKTSIRYPNYHMKVLRRLKFRLRSHWTEGNKPSYTLK